MGALPHIAVFCCLWGGLFFSRSWLLALLSALVCVGLLSLPQGRRAQVPGGVLLGLLLLLLLSFPLAWDHQRAVELGFLPPLAVAFWAWGGSVPWDERFWRFFAATVAWASLVALFQVFGGLAWAQASVEALPEAWREVGTARLATGRAMGTVAIPGHFALLQGMAAPFLVTWLSSAKGFSRLFPLALALLSLGGCLATRSLLGTALWVVAVGLTWYRGGLRRWALGVWAAVGLAALVLIGLLRDDLGRLEPLVLRSVNWRVALWAFTQSPWVGVGLGGVGMAGLTSPWGGENTTPLAHNTPLQLLAEFGLAGVPMVLVLAGGACALVVRLWPHQRPMAVALALPLLHNLFDFSFYEPAVLLPFCLVAGGGRGSTPSAAPWVYPLLAVVLGLSATAAAASGRAQGLADQVRGLSPPQRLQGLLAAGSLAPWRVSETLEAAWVAWQLADPGLAQEVEAQLDRRAWVAPRSASWAQAKSMMLLLQGRRQEAWAWAEEAVRRAPFREDLRQWERVCRP
ncbi:MAG: hypothetical protein N2447_08335 [Thermoanaerobaculum sp.]|nr:hypothetical protein [Thermoanaerobaculum sp.]